MPLHLKQPQTMKLPKFLSHLFDERTVTPELFTEGGQSVVRIWVAAALLTFVLLSETLGLPSAWEAMTSAGFYLLFAVAWLWIIVKQLLPHVARRTLALVLDNVLLAAILYTGGEGLAVLTLIPICVAIGNGMRYGRQHAIISIFVGGISVGAAVLNSPFWQTVPSIANGVIAIAIFVPLYASHLHRVTAHEAQTDSLTGLLNKRGFTLAVERFLKSRGHEENSWAVIMLDLDGFKAANDKCGHGAADDVLVEVASRIREVIRFEDRACRWGGDEFSILLAAPSIESVSVQVAQRVMKSLSEIRIPGYAELRIGASIGICEMPDGKIEGKGSTLIHVADYLMYQAKKAGKNCYRSSRDPEFSLEKCLSWAR